MVRSLLVLLHSILFFAIADRTLLFADLYRWTDADGTEHFSDSPPAVQTKSQRKNGSKLPTTVKNYNSEPDNVNPNSHCAKPVMNRNCEKEFFRKYTENLPPECRNRGPSDIPPKYNAVCDREINSSQAAAEHEKCIIRWEIDKNCEQHTDSENIFKNKKKMKVPIKINNTFKDINSTSSNEVYEYIIKSSNMEDSISNGDKLTIQKNASIIKRKDIIAYMYPDDTSKVFIGRVIGLPGDVVKMINKIVYVNNSKLIEKYAVHKDKNVIDARANPRDNNGPITLSSDEYFVLGDNRDRSYDCRFWSGSIKKSGIVGKVLKVNKKKVLAEKFL